MSSPGPLYEIEVEKKKIYITSVDAGPLPWPGSHSWGPIASLFHVLVHPHRRGYVLSYVTPTAKRLLGGAARQPRDGLLLPPLEAPSVHHYKLLLLH
jgi:hypothetical protein